MTNSLQFTDIRSVQMPDGTHRNVAMTEDHWTWKEGLEILEKIDETQWAKWALEEVELHNGEVTFDSAYRTAIAYLSKQWKR